MQAVVCEDEIGWRKNARRLLVFCTDSGFHIAGDGKLGGIVEPNDGLCHMDNNVYTHSLLQDYPSVYHLSHKVKENAINVIFAVTQSELQVYNYLAKGISGAVVGSLEGDSSNILQLVEEQYKKISSMVEMQHDAPDGIAVTFYTSCNTPDVKQSNACDDLKIEENIEFIVEIKVLECPQDSKEWEQTFKIFPVGSHEALEVQLKMKCDCECEHPGHDLYEDNSSECSNNGTYMCGTCSCNDFHYGQKCECNYDKGFLPSSGLPNDCKANKDSKTPECSGHGNCICGACVCNSDDNSDKEFQFYGKYCQCNDFSCDRADNKVCADHGVCICGKCSCEPEWTGDDCNCMVSKENCKADDDSDAICSNHGECKCGGCECNEGYEGQFCQQVISPLGRQAQCDNLFPCVLCLVHKKGSLTAEECSENCTSISIEIVDSIEDDDHITCVEYDDDGCRSLYQYYYNDSSVAIVKAVKVLECPLQRAAAYLVGIIGSILVAGLIALIIWKLIAMHKDKQDFIKFKNERDNATWNAEGNPLYREPVTTFANPAYKALS